MKYIFLFLSFFTFLFADDTNSTKYVIQNDNILVPKTTAFIETLSSELESKLDYRLYVVALDSIPDGFASRDEYKSHIAKDLKSPYTIIFLFTKDKKMDLLSSDPFKYFNEDDVYFEYMSPLIPEDEAELNNKRYSAIILNGYVAAADFIADGFGITLENSFPKDESGSRTFTRMAMYFMLFSMLGLLFLIFIFRKK